MGKYQQDAKLLLEYVGGKENIAAVSHCVTRMRFVLNDPAKADVAKIETLKSAKGTFTQAGQFQVIIGNTVQEFYNDFTAVSGLEGVSKEAAKSAAKQNQTTAQRIMSALAEIFAPLIPAIITGGLILGFRNCIDSLYLFENGTKTLCDISQFWAGIDSFLWLIGEAVFHMLPVGICWSVTKKMGTTQILGIVLGLTLVSGQLLNAYSVATTAAADIPYWDFGFFKVNMIGYQAQVIPAILAAFTLVYLEKFFRKICPAVVSMIFVPFCSLLLSVIAAHFVLGPIGSYLGTYIAQFMDWFYNVGGFVAAALLGGTRSLLTMMGMHYALGPLQIQQIAETGISTLLVSALTANFAQGGSAFGAFLAVKDKQMKSVASSAALSAILGITEPAMYGVNLKYRKPFAFAMVSSAISAAFLSFFHAGAMAYAPPGLFTIITYQADSFVFIILGAAMSFAIAAVLTFLFGVPKESKQA